MQGENALPAGEEKEFFNLDRKFSYTQMLIELSGSVRELFNDDGNQNQDLSLEQIKSGLKIIKTAILEKKTEEGIRLILDQNTFSDSDLISQFVLEATKNMKKAIEWWQHVYYPEFSQAKFEEEEEIIAKQGYKELSTNISRLIAVESRDAMQTLNLQLLDELDQKVFEIREA